MRTIQLFLVFLFAALLPACSQDISHFPQRPSAFDQPQAQYNVAPKQFYETAKHVVSTKLKLPIEQEKNGSFITGYKDYPGEWHIARRWQERTRFRVTVIPDFDNPTSRASLEVVEETETRAADGMKWSSTDISRPERARELLDDIQKAIGASSGAAK
jgi:hypothetical protein